MLCGYESRLLVVATGICAHKQLAKNAFCGGDGVTGGAWLVGRPNPTAEKISGLVAMCGAQCPRPVRG